MGKNIDDKKIETKWKIKKLKKKQHKKVKKLNNMKKLEKKFKNKIHWKKKTGRWKIEENEKYKK
mgnify:CR=1 FL=1